MWDSAKKLLRGKSVVKEEKRKKVKRKEVRRKELKSRTKLSTLRQ